MVENFENNLTFKPKINNSYNDNDHDNDSSMSVHRRLEIWNIQRKK